MGQSSILTEKQQRILDLISQEKYITSKFYFTGGTALSEIYLQHRDSVDLDFFTPEQFDPQIILEILEKWAKSEDFSIQPRFADPVNIYMLIFSDGTKLKTDFAKYPYKQLKERTTYKNIKVDSIFDIAVNKLLTITQRVEVKDYVDLYFLLKQFNFWELKDGVEMKFNMKIEPFLIGTDYMAVETFEILPKMHKELDLTTLKEFFRKEAKLLSKISTE